MYCLCFLLWGVPNFLVHPWGFLASVFRYSSNGKNFAAVRVGQQTLQGSHLAPSAFLAATRWVASPLRCSGLSQLLAKELDSSIDFQGHE
jgi:hypothetical protein